jgi:biopolymer transport protein ExbB
MTKNSGVSFKEVREVAEAEGSRQAGMLSQRISYLSDIGAVAPMVGLLGTVIGMINAFGTMSSQLDTDATQRLASSIQEALITTASGLIIGIVAVLFYSYFRGRVKKHMSELEAAATHLMALLAAQSNRRTQSNNSHSSPQVPPATIEDDYSYHSHSVHDGPSPIEEGRRDIDGI